MYWGSAVGLRCSLLKISPVPTSCCPGRPPGDDPRPPVGKPVSSRPRPARPQHLPAGVQAVRLSDTEAYGKGDGVRLTPAEGYLTTAAAIRTLPEMTSSEIRDRLNHLLRLHVLHRGLIVPCSECERRAFYRIELLSESNTCPRCGAPAHVTAAWRSEHGDPEWFYDLHGAVRELLEQDGDVPFLARLGLSATVRSFAASPSWTSAAPATTPMRLTSLPWRTAGS